MRPDIFSNKLQRRIAKISSRSISSFNWLLPYFVLPWRAKTFKTSWKYIGSVIKNFFVLQFFQKWGFYHISVVNVESPLDDTVPFVPGKIDIYMHFVNFWLSPLSMLIQRFGAGRSLPFAKEFVEYITKAYNEAARVYKFRLTTTDRPDYRENVKFKNIHKLDPHYLCVPSLHVAIVVLCFSYYKMLFERENFTEREKGKWNKELYEGAIAITESVLFVKQHSVNCIPAALYMMSHITNFFTTDDAVNFINELFKNTPELTGENRRAVIEHIHYMYERLILEGCHEDDWAVPVQRWIVRHAKETGQDKTEL